MSRNVAALLLLLALASLRPVRAGASEGKATIAVLPFEIAEVVRSDFGPEQSNVLTDALVRVLVNTRKFTVVDRTRLKSVRKEQRFGGSGLVDGRSAAATGRLLGADYLVLGSITDYSAEPPREMAYGSGWTRPVRISVELQVVDSSTGQVVAARHADAAAQHRVASPDAAGMIPRAALDRAGDEVAHEALTAILNVAFPVKILEVSAGDVRLNRGDDGGLAIGTLLNCFASSGKKLVDPDTKESLGRGERATGSVRVAEVQSRTTVAKVVDDQGLASGQVCRTDQVAEDAPGAHREPPPAGPIHAY